MKKSRRRRQLKSRAKSRSKRTSSDRQPLGFELLEARHLLATLLVNSTADTFDLTDSVVTLRDAIHAANTDTAVAPGGTSGSGADTITFDASVFSGGNASLIRLTAGELEITDTLKIEGSTGRDVTITGDANDDDITVGLNITDVAASFEVVAGVVMDLLDDNSRVLNFSASTGDLTLEGLTVTGGRTITSGADGGGIRFNSNGDLSLTNSKVSGNSTAGIGAEGGGIYTRLGVTLTNSEVSGNSTSGHGADGGGIDAFFGDVSLNSSTVSGNSTAGDAALGGGISTGPGDVNLTSSTLSGNRTSGDGAHGGGIFTVGGAVNLNSSTVSGNSTTGGIAWGGGIFTTSGAVHLTSSMLSGNTTSGSGGQGGGIFNDSGDVSLNSSTLKGNSTAGANAFGGGIRTNTGDVNLTLSTLSGNSTSGAGADGGAIFAFSGDVSLTSSTVSGNSTAGAGAAGGGIYARIGSVSLVSSTVSGNVANGVGGGVFVSDSTSSQSFTIENSIIAGNTDDGTAPDFLPDPNNTLTVNHSLIGATDLIVGGTGNQIGKLAAPIDPMLGPLADNSGPTLTHALLPGSPAIDAGNPSALSNYNFEDNDGSLDDWTAANNAIVSADQAFDGKYSAKIGGDAAGFSELVQSLAVQGGSAVVAQVQALVDTALPTGQFGELKIEFYEVFGDSYANRISESIVVTADDGTAASSWNVVENIATAPANAVEARIVLTYVGTDSSSSVFYDSVTVLGAGDTPRHDQRGAPFSRDDGNGVDIGSYERQTLAPSFFVVTTTADELEYSNAEVSLREAISSANGSVGPDTITFDAGVFTGGASSLIRLTAGELEITDTLKIEGLPAIGVTITGDADGDDVIDAGSVAGFVTDVAASGDVLLEDNSRVLNFSSPTGNLSLVSLTLTGGRTTANQSSTVSTYSGGGIRFNSSGSLSLSDTTVSGNSTTGNRANGGGIFTTSGDVSLTSSTVSGNSTSGTRALGGGISTSSGAVHLTSSTVSGNSTSGIVASGGGIFTFSGAVNLTSSTVSGNNTAGTGADGGGIYTASGTVHLASSTLSGNSTSGSDANGGGIYSTSGAVNLTSSTLSGNSTAGNNAVGGGMFSGFGAVYLTSSTLAGNMSAMGVGGGVFVPDTSANPSFTIENSIVAGNTDNGTAPDLRTDPDSALTINHSLIGATDLTVGGTGNQIGTLAAPIDALLGPLSDNGGPTLTQALLPGSPAINAGDPNAVAGVGGVPEFDQRGTGFDRVLQGGLDIGAFESLLDAVLLGDVNQDDSVNFLDIAPFIALLTSGIFQAEADVNQDGMVTFLDIAPFIGVLSSSGTSEARLNLTVVDEATNPAAALNDASKVGLKNELTCKGEAGLVASSTTANSKFPSQRGTGKLSFADLSPQKNDADSAEPDTTPTGQTLLRIDAADAQPSVRVLDPSPLSIPDLATPTVPLSDGSAADNNNQRNHLPNNTDEFSLTLAGDVTLDRTVDGVNDALDSEITIDPRGSSAAIDEVFADFEV